MKATNIITKFFLLFCKKRYQTQIGLYDKRVEYKRLFGKTYVLREYALPPVHTHCRCVKIPPKKTEWVEAPEE